MILLLILSFDDNTMLWIVTNSCYLPLYTVTVSFNRYVLIMLLPKEIITYFKYNKIKTINLGVE